MRRYGVALMMVCVIGLAHAQTTRPADGMDALRSHAQKSIDAAMIQARIRAAEAKANPTAPLPEPKRSGQPMADIGALAQQFQDGEAALRPARAQLLVFVSTSMPKGALERIGHDLAKLDGVMMLRGIRGPLGVKNALHETMQYLEPAAKTGVAIQIDPGSFRRYRIDRVPAVVIAESEGSCDQSQCENFHDVMFGDVSIAYALEEMVKQQGPGAARAAHYLNQLERNAR